MKSRLLRGNPFLRQKPPVEWICYIADKVHMHFIRLLAVITNTNSNSKQA
jgi:hypothetical protein